MNRSISLIKDIFKNRNLILRLSHNDFKTKYAGSYFGIVWAFIQPIMTILVFWFVFQIGFRTPPVKDVPFILWLMTGLVPWFFFSEAWINATNCYFEYSYLVKKVLFKVSILPCVKILSSWYVHFFFILFMISVHIIYKVYPTIYCAQLIYYMFCLVFYILSISFISSSLVVFFKDIGQIISIILQFGMWLTPILWSYTEVAENYRWIFKINPLFYIVEGYRDAMFNHVWFWEKINESLWFWDISIIYFILGIIFFKKLKPHFADVL